MISWRRCLASAVVLVLALTAAWPSLAQSRSAEAQSGVVIFWDVTQCAGGFRPDVYSAHCEPGPAAIILDFNAKTQFSCVDGEAVDIRWKIPAGAKLGPPIPPTEISWRPECWKAPIDFDVSPDATILTPQYSQTPPPNNYMTMNAIVLYDSSKPIIKICLVPLFPKFAVRPACAEAEIRS
jgi:hypothetical protein